jgi:hypothetical protein
MVNRLYGLLSAFTSVAVIATPQSVEDNLNWLIRAFFGITVAIIGYFVKKMMDEKANDRKRLARVETRAAHHNLILKLWIEHIGNDLEARQGNVGRRATDVALANLLTAIRGIQEDEEDGNNLAG